MFLIWFFIMGVCAFCSFWFLCNKRPGLSILNGIGSLISFALFIPSWTNILIESGKNPMFLGVKRYPGIVAFICAIVVLNILFMILAAAKIRKNKKAKNSG